MWYMNTKRENYVVRAPEILIATMREKNLARGDNLPGRF